MMLKTVLLAALTVGAVSSLQHTDPLVAVEICRSPIDLAVDAAAGRLYVVEDGAPRVSIVDLETDAILGTVPLPAAPSGVALSAAGDELYVTAGVGDGVLVVVDAGARRVTRTIPLGHSPVSPVVDAAGRTLWFCDRFRDVVGSVDLSTDELGGFVPAPREPIACDLSADGATLVVATHLPSGPAGGDYAAAEVLLVDTAARTVRARVGLPDGSMSLRDLCLSPDGRFAFVPHVLGRYHHPATQLERGWVNTNALSLIDLGTAALRTTVLLDRPERGSANPWGVACTPDGAAVVVTLAGSHAVQVLDVAGVLERLGQADDEALVPDDLAFLEGLRREVRTEGLGPRALALAGDSIYVAEHFSGSVGVVGLDSSGPGVRSIPLGPVPPLTEVRRGELLFHDARICFQQWQSCASCHPDARADGLNWDLMNDGFGNPKNTKSMLLAHRTPPTTSIGIRENAEASVRAGLHHIHFAARPDAEAVAIDAYLKSLRAVPSPWLVDGALSEAARRGREVYAQAGCAHCHPAPLYTDLQLYDVGTGRGSEVGVEFDTPTLVEVWRTAPYLHDGRAGDLLRVLVEHNRDDRHGRTAELSGQELQDLLEYVRSL